METTEEDPIGGWEGAEKETSPRFLFDNLEEVEALCLDEFLEEEEEEEEEGGE